MKEILKKYLPNQLNQYLIYLRNWEHNIYSLNTLTNINLETNISDFFIWGNEFSKIEFVAENLRALLIGKNVKVIHNLRFFSEEGEFIGEQKFSSTKFFERIKINPIKTKSKYISFTHFVYSDNSLKKILEEAGLQDNKNICEQNRGYTIYYPGNNNFGCSVHGNFGGISKNKFIRSKTNLKKHIYTSVYEFNKNSIYEIVFNNPTVKSISIKILFNNSNEKIILEVPSFGTKYLKVKSYKGSISFESNLPICRPLLFKNPAPNFEGNFDVFHS